jgi:oxygen-independent coproporphyrinogen-3 oxidase
LAGLYIHIPFCRQKCAYCDFYSIVNTKLKGEFVNALCKEIELQKHYLEQETIQTIYFGGGTPTLLEQKDFIQILDTINKYFIVDKDYEITVEGNPDDLSKTYIKELKQLGVNRLSIGIQSFSNSYLSLMKRKHSVQQSIDSVKMAQDQGFNNISIDLIYGLPDLSLDIWEQSIEAALDLNIQHISAYHLTIEPNTLFNKFYIKGNLNLPSETESLNQFQLLKQKTAKNGFLHYEISNFALDGFLSLHNTNYWMGVKYLGLGPSAHSYNLTSRQWNIQNLRVYLDEITKGKLPYESEKLTEKEKFNDYVITSLRTMWGLNTEIIKTIYTDKYEKHILLKSQKYIDNNLIEKNGSNYILTEKGIFISDSIIQDLLYD